MAKPASGRAPAYTAAGVAGPPARELALPAGIHPGEPNGMGGPAAQGYNRRRGCRASRPGAGAPGGEPARGAERQGRAGGTGLQPRRRTLGWTPAEVPE